MELDEVAALSLESCGIVQGLAVLETTDTVVIALTCHLLAWTPEIAPTTTP